MPETVRRRLLLYGAVQGVGFRYWAVREAAAYDVRGYVRNLGDGSVEAVIEGPRAEVERFAETLKQGPPYGRVSRIKVVEESPRGEFTSFEVRF
ncbi:MAG: acylphosphatase [Candidatus Zixiibacteriota bacterium]